MFIKNEGLVLKLPSSYAHYSTYEMNKHVQSINVPKN